MDLDIVGGIPLPPCPPPEDATKLPPFISGNLHNPIISVNLLLQSVLAFMFALIIAFRYNRIWLFGRYLHNRYLSNHLWVWFFALFGLCSFMDANRYILNLPYYMYISPHQGHQSGKPQPVSGNETVITGIIAHRNQSESNQIEYRHNVDTGVLLTTLVLRAVILLFLALSLLWQKRYRCGLVPGVYKEARRRGTALSGNRYRNYFYGSIASREDLYYHYINTDNNAFNCQNEALLSPSSSDETLNNGRFAMNNHERKRTLLNSMAILWFNRMPNGRHTISPEKICITVFLISLVTLYLNLIPTTDFSFYFYVGSLILLYAPIIVLMVYILFSPTSPSPSSTARIISISTGESQGPEGPTIFAKLSLFLGVLFGTIFSLPSNILSRLLVSTFDNPPYYPPSDSNQISKCYPLFHQPAFSIMDVLQVLNIFALCFLFSFVRKEFHRVKQQCVWTTVGRVQETFGIQRQYADSRSSSRNSALEEVTVTDVQ